MKKIRLKKSDMNKIAYMLKCPDSSAFV